MQRLDPTLERLCERLRAFRVVGWGNGDPVALLARYCQQFAGSKSVLVADPDPIHFLCAFLAGVATENCRIFLGNPGWQRREWQQVFELVEPDVVLGPVPSSVTRPMAPAAISNPSVGIAIPTGGSSGRVRFALHDWETLSASVAGTHAYFDRRPLNSYCLLPLHHVSGLMQFLRAFLTGGQLVLQPYAALKQAWREGGSPQALGSNLRSQFFISLVPTQLQQLLDLGAASWLAGFRVVLLGGAPPWPTLLERARRSRIPLGLTYGSTETASQVATLKPADFLAGNASSGPALPHARLKIAAAPGKMGRIGIAAASLFRGYYPDLRPAGDWFWTDDLGWLDAEGYLHVCGRCDRAIHTGGETVMCEEVEAALLATSLVTDVCVVGVADRHWGERIAVLYTAEGAINAEAIGDRLQLARYKHPKTWLRVLEIPRNDRGKADLAACQQLVADLRSTEDKYPKSDGQISRHRMPPA